LDLALIGALRRGGTEVAFDLRRDQLLHLGPIIPARAETIGPGAANP